MSHDTLEKVRKLLLLAIDLEVTMENIRTNV